MSQSGELGAELRRLRVQSGYTLGEFAVCLNYSKGFLSKVERGLRRPSPDLLRRADHLLDSAGRLQRLAAEDSRTPRAATADAHPESSWDAGRREILLTALGATVGHAFDRFLESSESPGSDLGQTGGAGAGFIPPGTFAVQLDALRKFGQSTSPEVLLPVLEAQTEAVLTQARCAGGRTRSGLLIIGARFAEYTGWMAQEAGNDHSALRWTARAVSLGKAGGDLHLAAYALVRRALVTLYAGDPAQTVALATRAQTHYLPPRIRALAAQREAQGHALAGNETACLRALERARGHFAADSASAPEGPVIGTSHLSDPAAMVTGWCLHDLGRVRQAAAVLDTENARIPAHALRSRARYGVRRALAHASAGELEHACDVAREALAFGEVTSSATVRHDVRRFAAEVRRFHATRSVQEIQPLLLRAIRTSTV